MRKKKLNIILFKNVPFIFRSEFRQGLVSASKPVIYPILEWLLKNITSLKQRAYLARYLVKIDLPPDMQQDEQVRSGN